MADQRPPPKNLFHHLSRLTQSRKASEVKDFYKYFRISGIAQLGGGLPSDQYFPFDTLEAKVARPDRWKPTPNKPVEPPSSLRDAARLLSNVRLDQAQHPTNMPEDTIVVPHTSQESNPIKKIDLASALQYSTAQGYPPLYYFVRQFARDHMHPNCPYQGGPEVVLTCGNTDGIAKCLEAFTNVWSEEHDWTRDREGILVEEFAFMGAIQCMGARGLNVTPVKIDEEGMMAQGPGGLEDVLKNWDLSKGKRPHLMYTITVGQNPTSGLLSLERRSQIYALCSHYDIVIIEDDPYWYLQYPTSTAKNTTTTSDSSNMSFNPDINMFANAEPRPDSWKSSGYEFIDSLVPSYLQIDVDGRVLRLDTFSKTVAPGCRLGWITAQPVFIERLLRIAEATTAAPSGFVQSLIAELILGPNHTGLDQGSPSITKDGRGGLPQDMGWKADGWVRWLEGLRGHYERRMTNMCLTLDAHADLVQSGRRSSLDELVLHDPGESEGENDEWSVIEKTRLYSFEWPGGGMFVWLRVLFENHPLYRTYAAKDETTRLSLALWVHLTHSPCKVLTSPGSMFASTNEIRRCESWRYFRLCFAFIPEDDIVPVTKRSAEGIAAFFRIKDAETIEKLAKEFETGSGSSARLDQLVRMAGPC